MLDYFDITEKINELRSKSNVTVTNNITDKYEKDSLLRKVFKNKYHEELDIFNMTLEQLDKYSILSYCTKEMTPSVEKINIVILDKQTPLLKVESYSEWYRNNPGVETEEYVYSVYDEDSSKLKNRLKVKNSILDGMVVKEIKILNKQEDGIRSYTRHNYRIYTNVRNNEVLGFVNHDKVWLKGALSFEQRLATINENINKVSNIISDSFEELVNGEKVKQYEIKRKNK